MNCNLLHYNYFSNHYNLIVIDLKIEKAEEKSFSFSQNSVGMIKNGSTKDHKFSK